MVILVIDTIGLALDMAHYFELEGHDVLYFVQEAEQKDVGENILVNTALDKWGRYVRSVDLVVFTDCSTGAAAESLKKRGFPVIGGTPSTDRLESDRAFAMTMAKTLKLKVPRWREFKTSEIDDAIKYAKRFGRLVLKPNRYGAPRWLTYIARDKDDMVGMLEYLAKSNLPDIGPSFVLQEHIEGREMSVGAWFNGFQFVKPVFDNWEFNGHMGPGRGANIDMGCIGRYVGKSKLFGMCLKPWSAFLKGNKYTGYVDVTTMIKDGIPYFLGLTTRFGYPTINLQLEAQREDFGNFLLHLARGETRTIKVMPRWVAGICVDTLPSPLESTLEDYKGIPVTFPNDLSHIHFGQLKKVGDRFVTAGTSGFTCLATGHAKYCDMAVKRAYDTLRQIHVPAMMYRRDIKRVPGEKDLRDWRFLS